MTDTHVRLAFTVMLVVAAFFVGIGIADRSLNETVLAAALMVMTEIARFWRFHDATD